MPSSRRLHRAARVAALDGQVNILQPVFALAAWTGCMLLLANRNYMNLLELPVLFYVGCLVAYATGVVGPLLQGLAWLYVALRVLHSLVHVTYNQVMHRFAAFALSNGVLVAMWVALGLALFRTGSAA